MLRLKGNFLAKENSIKWKSHAKSGKVQFLQTHKLLCERGKNFSGVR